jgi:hypothetical protein
MSVEWAGPTHVELVASQVELPLMNFKDVIVNSTFKYWGDTLKSVNKNMDGV